ncbi:GntR family transcriptional regulator [Roseibium album]|uniref:GntR family transcriptional regulator n=1 Tax=Roseibium album TaxID=311410 RepID=UPI001A29A957|nr:DNA-binding GntR family transcriptional regulator [Labrenzia sp. EL_162]MBG6162098.1 DNA-binding GntR family transcriptional regulator [Labrenzia sp. EL_195]MBG6193030.1 DNA-binding GntR family transcriptional regulator [Labrenzia sp. EL_159]
MSDRHSALTSPPANDRKGATSSRGATREQVDAAIRSGLLTGRFIPGKAVTIRGLATDLGVSPMPVREVLQRLAAENALEVKSNGRVQVPDMTPDRFDEVLKARLLLEPELAERSLDKLSKRDVKMLTAIDDEIDQCIISGDAEAYMRLNHAFHFHVYRASGSKVLLPLIDSLWLQFAPFMRTVYGRVGTAILVDQHKEAIRAIEQRDRDALRDAIMGDITDGMGLIGKEILETT